MYSIRIGFLHQNNDVFDQIIMLKGGNRSSRPTITTYPIQVRVFFNRKD